MTQITNDHHPPSEVDLIDIIHTLWAWKILILAITLAVTCAAAAYAFFSTPIYQTSVYTLPPPEGNLASYNLASQLTGDAIRGTVSETATGIPPITPHAAYKVFLRHLGSATIRQQFFDNYYLPAQEDNASEAGRQRAWRQLDKELDIKLPIRDQDQASMTLEGTEPKIIAAWADAYVQLAADAAREELLRGLRGEVDIRKRSLEDQIATVRQVAREVRQSHITRLRAALEIAERIGLEKPADGMPLIAINTQELIHESINSGSLPYLRGSKALRSELHLLEKRENDDAYIPELPNLLKKQALLKNIDLNPAQLSVMMIDQAAIIPEEPIKPKRGLIVLLGVAFGFFLGAFIILFRQLIMQRM